MKCTHLACAQSIITDKTTNQVSIINIIENIISENFPIIFPSLSLLISSEKENGEDFTETLVNLKIFLNDVQLYEQPIQIIFIEPDPRNNSTINMQGVFIKNEGMLSFVIEHNGNRIRETHIRIQPKK